MTSPPPHVVILGGGFGGLAAARGLDGAPARVTLIDRQNHHLFQPLLYQVATAGLNPGDIATPLRRILRHQQNLTVLLGEARAIDPAAREVHLADGETCGYDFLIVATGATHSYFGHDPWRAVAPGLKDLGDALEIRRRVLSAFEAAERETDEARRRALLSFVVVGAGPTGVELAGALAEIARRTLLRDFRRIHPEEARIVLVEAGPRVLPTFPPDLSERAGAQLAGLGVEVRLSSPVSAIDADGVTAADQRIPARTVLWGAGVQASPLARSFGGAGAPLDRAGRVLVAPDLRVPGYPTAFVIGDLASVSADGKPVPGVAPAAMQMGRHAAALVRRAIETPHAGPGEPFRYLDKGSLATIGRSRAVAQFGRLHVSGIVAWWLWLFVHIVLLIGFRNRIVVLIQWAYAWFTEDRGARLITAPGAAAATEPGSEASRRGE